MSGASPQLGNTVRIDLAIEAAPVVVGDAFDVTVTVHHAQGASVELGTSDFDYSWVVFDRGGSVTRAADDGLGAITTQHLTLASLEAEARELPVPAVLDASGKGIAVEVGTVPTLEVAGVLGTEEDAPRPIIGFLETPPEPEGLPLAWAALPLIVILALAAWFMHRRREPGEDEPPRATPEQRLAALEARKLDDSDDAGLGAQVHRELTHLVREYFDLRAETSRVSATDEEWLELAGDQLSDEQRTRLADLFLESRAVKYGGARPTHWALKESIAAARAVLDDASQLEEAAW